MKNPSRRQDHTHADAGTLYLITEDRSALHFEIVCNDTLAIAPSSAPGFPDLPLHTAAGAPNKKLVAVCAVLEDRTINIADAHAEAGFDFSGTREFDARTGYRSRSFLTVPMKNHEGTMIGVLQLINARHPETGAVDTFPQAAQHLAESLASQAAIALSNRKLINQLEALFESFIGLINLAIDEKSPYTGGHCQHVPALTMMIAEAVNATREGPLADFTMSVADLHELKIAGLRKLLEMRKQADAGAEAVCWADCREELAALDGERAFLRQANIGVEAMDPSDQQRVRDIATRHRWRNQNGVDTDFLTADEIENLTIRSGTLTAAEREVINHHIVATLRMLEALPWPKHLKNVPEYAGGHHERMDGKGYPKGLTREQMSLQARMMGIADIFEALTARDRPYKPGMKLSQALEIMRKFAANGHIDPDLYRVFIDREVFRRYAETTLDPAQIDI